MLQKSIGFIGTGKMATALISCIYKNNLSKSIIASNKNYEDLKVLKNKYKIKITKNNIEVVGQSDVVFICVKPQDIDFVLNEIKGYVNDKLIISIAAGIKLNHLENVLKNKRIIRLMPNINCMVGEMAAGYSAGKYASQDDIEFILQILGSAGVAILLKEKMLDIVGAISGSGPAFVAYFAKAMQEEGIKNGLPKAVAFKLVAQTILGTGTLMIKKNFNPDEIIKMVASKKGITTEGLKFLKNYKFNSIVRGAINEAAKKSKRLGK